MAWISIVADSPQIWPYRDIYRRQLAVLLLFCIALTACSARNRPEKTGASQSEPRSISLASTVVIDQTATSTETVQFVPSEPAPILTPSPQSSFSPILTATQTASPTSPTATPGIIKPAKTPTLTPAPTLPAATIQILSPGPASKIVSPLKLSAYLPPGARGNVRLELFGEDGRLLVRKIMSYSPVAWVHVLTDMDFEINAVAELGRLVVSTEDKDGRTNALASVDLLLLSVGQNDINPPGNLQESIIIREPIPLAFVQGGVLTASGLARPAGKDPFIVEIIAKDGSPVGPTRLLTVPTPSDGSYSSFSIDIPYTVSSPTWALLAISEHDTRIPGITHLSSVEVLLSP